ncbi:MULTISPECIES: MarR family winged helix-turn-helix transcriptional regulator [Pseudofrankia]|uniref:MarR family winged helix-turn-helix transcriptional regulator n=1 Tax=Pseudofrankia TaxID=2994363 RepID=UPI000234D46E|nr:MULTISPECIES: MarR family transcriptional regulator [Pseudofrankia]OHV29122.1 MarR family transcriptional regulator [Pseudofrankia sp. EUN1h]
MATEVTQLFIDLVRVETRLYNAVDARLRAAHGLTAGQYQLMQIISERDTCRVLDLVQETAITVGAASKAVDRLEAAGWCRRAANPDDRRSSLLSLTPAGSGLLAQARPTFEEEVAARVVGVVTGPALQQTAISLAALRFSLERHQRAGEA